MPGFSAPSRPVGQPPPRRPADALSLVLRIRDDDPLRYEREAVKWLSRYTAEDRVLRLANAPNSSTCWPASAGTTQVSQFRLGRFLRARRYEVEADRLSA
jgi:hypothetical protein